MPNYKVVNADRLDADLTSVANAIRAKGGTTDAMAFPSGMVNAVNGIPTNKVEQEKSATYTENGDYTISPDSGKVLSSVSVKVNTPVQKQEQEKSITVTANGTQTVSPDVGKVLSCVTVNVNVPSTSPVLQTKAVSPATSVQMVSPDAGYDGLSAVTVEAVTAAIDSNIQPANIAAGVTILGVTGTHKGGANPETVESESAMNALLVGDNVGKVYKYVGASGAYENGAFYLVEQYTATYTITPTLTNISATGSNPSTIDENSTVTLTFTANTGYNLPDTVTVTGATQNWDQATGTLTLSNPTGNVIISIIGEATQAGHTISLTVLNLGEIAFSDGTTIKINSAPTSSEDWDYGTCYADNVGQGKDYELYSTDQLIQHTTGSSYSKISQPKTISDVTSIWVYWMTTYSDACITVNGIDYYPQDHDSWNNALEIPITTDCDVVMRVSYD